MGDNEINNYPTEGNSVPSEEMKDRRPQDGFTFKWINLVLGVAFCIMWSEGKGDGISISIWPLWCSYTSWAIWFVYVFPYGLVRK